MKKRILVCVAMCGLLMAGSLLAHHSLAGVYDMKADKELAGTVKSIKFVNPHGTLTVTVKNADGTTADWILSMGSATSLAGLKPAGVGPTGPNALRFGDAVKVRFIPATNGSPLGFLKSITYPDGHVVVVSMGGPND